MLPVNRSRRYAHATHNTTSPPKLSHETRQSKQLRLKTTPLFSRDKISCLRRDSNPQCSAYWADVCTVHDPARIIVPVGIFYMYMYMYMSLCLVLSSTDPVLCEGQKYNSDLQAHIHVYVYHINLCLYTCVHVRVDCTHGIAYCWLLLGNQNVKGPYLEAEVVEEVMGWLG